MSNQQKILVFIAFCVEEYKTINGISGRVAAERLNKYGALEYLMDNYDLLHSMGNKEIQKEISIFLTNHGYLGGK